MGVTLTRNQRSTAGTDCACVIKTHVLILEGEPGVRSPGEMLKLFTESGVILTDTREKAH